MRTSRAGTLVTADRAATGGGLRPGQSLERLLTDEGRVHMQAAVDAAARADTRGAYEHTVAGLLVAKSLHQQQLGELLLLGEDAPGWMYSGARRSGLVTPGCRTCDRPPAPRAGRSGHGWCR